MQMEYINRGIENLCTIIIDNASSNDVADTSLRKKILKKNGLVSNGEFFHMRCCAHMLNLNVKDGINELRSSFNRLRDV